MQETYWKDISTAPKDGTRFLVPVSETICIGYYVDKTHLAIDGRDISFGGRTPKVWMELPLYKEE